MANLSLKRGTTERTSWSEYGWTENVRGEEMGTSIMVAENSLRIDEGDGYGCQGNASEEDVAMTTMMSSSTALCSQKAIKQRWKLRRSSC
eukprot:scaffold2514_cov226-Alexandrium_tamarense.AAC.6